MKLTDESAEAPVSGMAAFQDALGDYYDAGMIGDPPRREDYISQSQHRTEWPDIPRSRS